MNDVERFKTERPEWSDLPDDLVEKSLAFAAWSIGEASRELWVEIVGIFRPPIERLLSWVNR